MIDVLERWTSPHDPSSYLASLVPRRAHAGRAVIESITPLTDSAAAIVLRPGRGWTGHRPGQFVTIGVDVDGVRHHRCYSITSLPRPRAAGLEIVVGAHVDGFVSTHLLRTARPGDVVTIDGPGGDFTLPAVVPERLLFVTGGTGITPVIGMMRWIEDRRIETDVVLLHHVPTRRDVVVAADVERWSAHRPSFRVVTTCTRQGGSRLDRARIERECPDWRDRTVFACGPESLRRVVADHWGDAGLAHRVHVESFVTGPVASSGRPVETPTGDGGAARFARSGVEAPAPGDVTLLEVAESAGLSPAAGCRMGICHTCSTRIEAGSARDLRDGRVTDAGSHVQLCVSVADGSISLDL